MIDLAEDVRSIVERLGLSPHPEGGYFREIYRSPLTVTHPGAPPGSETARSAATCITWLLPRGEVSSFHRVLWTDELWHLYAGGPLELHMIHADGRHEQRLLTTDPMAGEAVAVVEAGCWQAARVAPGVPWALGGCTVAPGFTFAEFELPSVAELTTLFPAHAAIIRDLTRR